MISFSWRPFYRVTGHSMEPSLKLGSLVFTRPLWKKLKRGQIQRGQIIVLKHDGNNRIIKRVIAIPGDQVELEAGQLKVNGIALGGHLALPGATVTYWKVPIAAYFVVGDNQQESFDSRIWAQPFVFKKDIEAVVKGTIS